MAEAERKQLAAAESLLRILKAQKQVRGERLACSERQNRRVSDGIIPVPYARCLHSVCVPAAVEASWNAVDSIGIGARSWQPTCAGSW